jgi:hypothetical protein
MGNYHHHQNPSAYKLDLTVLSNICTLYDADGLYVIDSTQHSPLIGFAYDGFPIYGAYGYKNADGTGGIVRIKSSWTLRNITTRTTYYTGASVTAGPAVSVTYPLGYFREDYQYTAPVASDYLDEHNGRFCVTPEYPAGIYCYFATVDANWNSAYPYAVGPTFYGVKTAAKVTSISESVTTYAAPTTSISDVQNDLFEVNVYPNPANDFVAVQINGINKENLNVELFDATGKLVQKSIIYQGKTIAYFDTQILYSGIYFVKIAGSEGVATRKIVIQK